MLTKVLWKGENLKKRKSREKRKKLVLQRRDKKQQQQRIRRLSRENACLEGVFTGHRKGFGFVTVEGLEEDVFIPEEDTGSALHLDRVRIVLKDSSSQGKRREGIVVKVLERGMPRIVGTYQTGRNYGFVVSDNPRFSRDVFLSQKDAKGVRNGDKVIVELTDYGSKNKNPQGKVIENLGNERSPGTDILAIVKSYGIPTEFPQRVLTQAERAPEQVQEADRAGRLSLIHLPTVTIDGEDAKDLDDAVSLTKEDGIYHLGVHIADVSNYVQGRSALDREALKRGTSVYLADRVIPMLPERLSNGICSLNQGEDRLTLSCLMDIDETGQVVSHKIAETVIRVDERMSYSVVKELLEGTNPAAEARYQAFVPMFFLMKELSGILRKKRRLRGAIDFSFAESKIILNGAGRAIDVVPHEANVATRIIEDFMLLANETVAKEYCTGGYPFVYRTHERPDADKVESLLSLVRSQGIPATKAGQEISPKEIQTLLKEMEGRPNETQISRLALRTMKQARYTTDCTGHFGLAARYYCHFTSPIRRYPDLQIHRIIKDNLRGRLTREGKTEYYRGILDEVAQQSSACERRAEEAEREVEKLKKAEYMSYHLGEEFDGVISGVTGWGLYVELANTVEGLVHVNTLRDDFYVFAEEAGELQGEVTKKVYRMGQSVRVRVEDADPALRTVDFVLVEEREDSWQRNQEPS